MKLRPFKLVALVCVSAIAACGGDGQTVPRAAPAPPDMLARLRTALSAAVVASEASCSATWLSSRTEPPCAREPRRALEAAEHAWMLTNETLTSVAAASAKDPSLAGLSSRLTLERILRDGADVAAMQQLAKDLHYGDAVAMLSAVYGFDVRATAAVAQQLLNASEGLYLVARTDVGIAAAEADGLLAKSIGSAKTVELAKSLVDPLLPIQTAPALSVIGDAGSSTAEVFFVAPDQQRVVAAAANGIDSVDAAARALAKARGRAILGEADASLSAMRGLVAASPIAAADWMSAATGLTEPALTRVVRALAYRTLESVRADASRSLDMLALFDGAPALPGALDPWMTSVVRFRARLLAAEVVSAMTTKLGPTWWQRPEAAGLLAEIMRDTSTSEALLKKLNRSLSAETLLVGSARSLARSDALVTRR